MKDDTMKGHPKSGAMGEGGGKMMGSQSPVGKKSAKDVRKPKSSARGGGKGPSGGACKMITR